MGTGSDPRASMTLPALFGSVAGAVVADLHRGCVGDLKELLVTVEHLRRLCENTPWLGGGAVQGPIDHLTCSQWEWRLGLIRSEFNRHREWQ